MAVNPLGMNQGTNSFIRFEDDGGTVNTQVIDMRQGSVVVTAGTISVGTITSLIDNLDGGTLNLIDSVTNVANLAKGTITKLEGGTLGNLVSGTINSATAVLNSGTINVGTFVMPTGTITVLPNLPQGSINVTAGTIATLGTMGTLGLAIRAGNVGTIESGTIGVLGTMGTLGLVNTVTTLTTVSNLTNGSVRVTLGTTVAGTLNLLDTVTNLTSGSVRMTVGTLTTGTLQNLVSGTVTSVTEVANLAKGTVTRLEGGTLNLVTTVSNVSAGSIAVVAGTIGSLIPGTAATSLGKQEDGPHTSADVGVMTLGVRQDAQAAFGADGDYVPLSMDASGNLRVTSLAAGTTVGTINVGTINTGTINAGTIRDDGRAARNIVSYGTQVVGTAAIAATITGSAVIGVGTSQWIQDFSILNPYGSVTVILGFGTAQQGTNVLYRGVLGTQTAVGIEKAFAKAVNANMTNQDLVLSLGAAGTVDLSTSYFISA